MRRFVTTALFLFLVVICTVVAVACQEEDGGDTVTTDAMTEAPVPTVTASEVDALILAIDGGKIENEKEIDAAFLAYCSLSDEEKANVLYYPVLSKFRYDLTKEYVVKEYMDSRMPHNELLIGAYVCNNTSTNINTDAHLQDMADCHIDYAWQVGGTSVLDLYQKYGIGVFEWSWALGIPSIEFNMTNEDFRAYVQGKNFDHEALWGVFQDDEPTLDQLDVLGGNGKIISEEVLPECALMANLFPIQGPHGAPSYKQYVLAMANRIENDMICYDHYFYDSGHIARALENLDLVAEVCRLKDRDFYIILQTFDAGWMHDNYGGPYSLSTDMMKLQAYSAMAYGVKSITWACWIEGWGENNVLDDEGIKTEQYYELRETNADLVALEPVYMRYTGTGAKVMAGHNAEVEERLSQFIHKTRKDELPLSTVADVTVAEGDTAIVGAFAKNKGEGEALMLVGCEDIWFSEETTSTVTFKTTKADAVVTAYVKGIPTVLAPNADGVYTVEIHNADAVFVTVD